MNREDLILKSEQRSLLKPSIYDIEEIYHRGYVERFPFDAYKTLPGLNPSTIAEGKKSMRHARKAYEAGKPETDAMVMGRYGHSLLFEPDRLDEDWIVVQGDRRGNKWRDAKKQARAENKSIICTDGANGADAMNAIIAEALDFRAKDLRAIIGHGISEVSMFLPWQGVQCKGRFDWMNTDSAILTDVKFQFEVSPKAIRNSASSFLYHVKMGCYKAWFEQLTGKEVKAVCLIYIETKGVVDVAIRWIPDWLLEDGIAQGAQIASEIAEELQHGNWYGYDRGETGRELEVPQWDLLEDQKRTIE